MVKDDVVRRIHPGVAALGGGGAHRGPTHRPWARRSPARHEPLLGAVLLLALSQAEAAWHFHLIWMGLGVLMAGALYEPCFAHLTHVLGAEARRSITTVTLIAGFAGTVSFPTSHLLAEAFGWRGAVLGLAALAGLAGCPLMWWGARLPSDTRSESAASGPATDGALGEALRVPVFWLAGRRDRARSPSPRLPHRRAERVDHGMLLSHFLPLVSERGVAGGAAVLAASLIGPMQILGRLAMVAVQDRLSMSAICMISFASTTLFFVAVLPLLVFVFVAPPSNARVVGRCASAPTSLRWGCRGP